MAVTKEQVKHLGWLAKIDLSDDELERNTGQIEEIIKYLDKLDSIALDDAKPITTRRHVTELRDDNPVEYRVDPFGTPHRKDGFVKGPRMT